MLICMYLRASGERVQANAHKSGCMCRDNSGEIGSLNWSSDSFPTGQIVTICLVGGQVS